MFKSNTTKRKKLLICLLMTFIMLTTLLLSAIRIFAADSEKPAGLHGKPESVILQKTTASKVASIRNILPSYDAQNILWNELDEHLKKQGIAVSAPGFTIYHGNKGRNVDLEVVQPVSELIPVKKTILTYDSVKKKISQLATAKMKQHQITGISLALVDDEKIIWTVSLGYADRENKIPVTADTLFRVGSNSKLFTAIAIMQLTEQGKIDIDLPLQTYIPEFSMKTRYPEAGPVTIRSIMAHRSGIPGNYLPAVLNPKYPYFTALVKDIKDEYVAYPPNFITAYSNLAITLLGVVVERASSQKFSDYVTDHILKPLEMNNSSFELRDEMKPLLSKGYRHHKPAVDDICPNISPEGSLRSSVNEMSFFLQMVLKNGAYQEREIIKKVTLDAMFTPQPRLPLDLDGCGLSTTGSVGLNWFLDDNPYWGKIGVHDGGTRLFFSRLMVLRDSKLGVIVLTNSVNGNALANEIAIETIKEALQIKVGPPGEYYRQDETPPRKIELKPMGGLYATTGMGLVEIKKQGKNYTMKAQKYPLTKFRLIAKPDQWHTIKPLLFGLFPIKVAVVEDLRFGMSEINGVKIMLSDNNGIRSIFGEKIERVPIPAVWRERCGRYVEIGNPGLTSLNFRMKLVVKKGVMMGYLKNDPFILTPLSDTELLIRGIGRDMHETIRIIKVNDEERLSYAGLQYLKKK